MRASEIIAASAFVAAANAAPYTFCLTYPFCGGSSQPQPVSSSSIAAQPASTSSMSSSAQGWPATSSSSVSKAASSSSSSRSVVQVSTSSTSVAAPASTSSISSSSAVKYTTSSAPFVTSSAPVVVSSTSTSAAATLTSSSTSSSVTVAPTAVASDDGYNFQQCATEPFQNGFVNTRALQGDSFTDPNMTVDLCAKHCSALGYSLFGVEYADECYCGNSLADGTSQADPSDCNMACAGDATEQCGGAGVFNLYELAGGAVINLPASTTYSAIATSSATSVAAGTGSGSGSGSASATATSTAAPTVVPAAGGFFYDTCAVDASGNGGNGRALTEASTTSVDGMTVELCASYCSSYAYFGVEYGRECYCGNTVQAGTTQDSTGGCNMACVGNSTELCGGSWHMELYYNPANGGSAVVLPATYTYSTTSTSSVAATTSSVVVATTSSVVPTTSSVVAPTTSSAAPQTSSGSSSTSSSAVATSTSSSVIKTTSSAAPTTISTVTKSSSTSSAVKATPTPTAPAVCAPVSSDLTQCPTLTMKSWFSTTTFNNYYKGTGYTLNPVNPANLLGMIFPQTIRIDGSKTICAAATYAMQQASGGLLSASYQSFDLHWRTDLCQWEASFQSGLFQLPSLMTQFFNVPNKNVGSACGFSQ